MEESVLCGSRRKAAVSSLLLTHSMEEIFTGFPRGEFLVREDGDKLMVYDATQEHLELIKDRVRVSKHTHVSLVNLVDINLEEIFAVISERKVLSWIYLSHIQLRGLGELSHVRELTLFLCQLDESLIQCLKQKSIEELTIAECTISFPPEALFREANRSLETLNLREYPMSLAVVQSLPPLVSFKCVSCPGFTDEVLFEFARVIMKRWSHSLDDLGIHQFLSPEAASRFLKLLRFPAKLDYIELGHIHSDLVDDYLMDLWDHRELIEVLVVLLSGRLISRIGEKSPLRLVPVEIVRKRFAFLAN